MVDAWRRCVREHIWPALWPPHCILCGRIGQQPDLDLCNGCEADLPSNVRACRRCGEPLTASGDAAVVCGACLRHSPRVDASVIPFRFAYPIDHLIRRLKYGGAVSIGRVLATLFTARFTPADDLPTCLIPVPLAYERFCERGYNQAVILAEHIHAGTHIPLRTDLIVRTRDTPEQAGLDRRARRKNLRRAFETIARPPDHVAIIDDVVTTGSTANEIARTLKRAGAKRVDVWAIARAGR